MDDYVPRQADVVKRTEFSTTYVTGFGVKLTVVDDEPLNLQENGLWKPIQTGIVRDGDEWTVEDHPLNPVFDSEADAVGAFSVEQDGHRVSFTLEGADDATARQARTPRSGLGADELEYREVFAGVDLKYEVAPSRVKETLVLAEPPVRATAYRWRVSAPGMTLAPDEFGGISIADASGKMWFRIPAAVMWDSSAVPEVRGAAESPVPMTLSRSGTDWLIELSPDQDWLIDPVRVYPVSIDPTVHSGTGGADGIWSIKSDGTVRSYVNIGSPNQGGNIWRSAVHYPYEAIFGKQLLDSRINASYGIGGTTNCYTGSVHWATSFTFGGFEATSLSDFPVCMTGSADGAGLDQRIAQWVRNQSSGAYLMLRGNETPTAYTLKEGLNTSLSLWWKDFPSVTSIDAPSPADGAMHVSTMPTLKVTGADPYGAGLAYCYQISRNAGFTDLVTGADCVPDSQWSTTAQQQLAQGILAGGTTYFWRGMVRDAAHNHLGTSTVRPGTTSRSFTTNTPAPTPERAASVPVDGKVAATLTPTFTAPTVTDPDGDPVRYQFRIATGSDGKTGAIYSSGWLDSPSWPAPVGALQDGGSYTWVVRTSDGIDIDIEPSWVNRLKRSNLRLDTSGASPFDTAGPVTVNLATGNLALGFSSPTVATVGGPIGMSFSYNSQATANALYGLTGRYFLARATPTHRPSSPSPARHRWWCAPIPPSPPAGGRIPPAPAVSADDFLVRWSGYLRPPAAGSYSFGVVRDDGAKLTVDNVLTVDQWNTDGATQAKWWGSPQTLTGQPVPIQLDYYDTTGTSTIQLWVRAPDGPDAGTDPDEFVVPSSWLSTTFQTLPYGWASSAPLAGAAAVYSSVRVSEAALVFTDVSGSVHTHTKAAGAGGYTPPVGEYGVASLDADGQAILTEDDGTVYTFTAAGRLESATTKGDALKPASPVIIYRASGQVDRIADRLSWDPATSQYTRYVQFAYGGDLAAAVGLPAADSDPAGSACPDIVYGVEGESWPAPPAGMLCRIIYPGHAAGAADTTRLGYNWYGQLVTIVDPGDEVTSFGYNDQGRLHGIQDSLGSDWWRADPYNHYAAGTLIGFDGAGRVISVKNRGGNPDLYTDVPTTRRYSYPDSTTTHVDMDGFTVPGGHASTVHYDAELRQTSVTSAMGQTASQTWNEKDQILTATNPQGLAATTRYDAQDRPIHSNGPAPAACFGADRAPVPCGFTPAHTATEYDQGPPGLHVAYYGNPRLAGAPTTFSLGLPDGASGAVDKDFGTAAPITGISPDGWSMRMTGLIRFPGPGTYTLETYADSGTQLWVDDVRVINDWGPQAPHWSPVERSVTILPGEKLERRIRLQFWDNAGTASLQLWWTPAGGTRILVPGTALSPDYGLANRVTAEDAAPLGSGLSDASVPDLVTTLAYEHPWLGAVTESTIDPGGLNLTTKSGYEAPGTGWLRRTTRLMPAGVAQGQTAQVAGTRYQYWGDREGLAATTCAVPAGTSQFGMLKKVITAQPATGNPTETEYVYDPLGRVRGTKRTGDADWSCTAYDLRSRPTTVTFAAFGGQPARTVTYNHGHWTTPLDASVTDPAGTISTRIDLLGRVVSYRDVWGTVTAPNYDPVTGRVTQVRITPPSGGPVTTTSFVYDLDGKVESVAVNGVEVANPGYDTLTQLLESIQYSNGTGLTGLTRNPAGAGTGMRWDFPGGQNDVTEAVVRSQSGRILHDNLTDGVTETSSYGYDAAGRLIDRHHPPPHAQLRVRRHRRLRRQHRRGPQRQPHQLMSTSDGGTTTTTAYCYDNADRLTVHHRHEPAVRGVPGRPPA